MIKPNSQIELHPAYMWTCDHCGEENFERCMVRDLIGGYDDDEAADKMAEAIAELSDEEIEAMIGNEDDDDGAIAEADIDDDGMVPVSSYSIPEAVKCGHCGSFYDDVVLSGEGM